MPDFESGRWRFEPSPANEELDTKFIQQPREFQGRVALERVTSALDVHDRGVGNQTKKFSFILVVND